MNFKTAILFIIGVCFFSCKKAPISDISNLNGDYIYAIGHGGTGLQSAINYFPENSFGGIKKAIEAYNADGVEIDVQITKDLQLVLYHDDKLETSTNGSGFIYEYTLAELNEFKFDKDVYSNLFLNEHITTLETVIQYCSERNIKPQIHLDLRHWLYDNTIYSFEEFSEIYTSTIVNLIQKYNYEEHIYLASGSPEILMNITGTNIKLMLESSDIYGTIDQIKQNDWFGIVAYNESMTKQKIDFAHLNNIRVALFSVKIQKDMVSAVNKHPDFIITDNIPQLQQILYN